MSRYTLVQHSGYGYGGDLQFARAVEPRQLHGDAEVAAVARVGGLVIHDYLTAETLADRINYPPELVGMIPHVQGRFATRRVDGLRVYIPVRTSVHPTTQER